MAQGYADAAPYLGRGAVQPFGRCRRASARGRLGPMIRVNSLTKQYGDFTAVKT